jgi:hypothetical protein
MAKENSVKRLGSFDGSTVDEPERLHAANLGDSVHNDDVSQDRGEKHPNPAGGVSNSAPERKEEAAILQTIQNVGFDVPDTLHPKP